MRVLTEGILRGWAEEVLGALGAKPHHASSVARNLVDASLRGIDSHGIARLPAYARVVDRGLIDLEVEPEVLRSDGATALIDARNGFGQPAGELAIQQAIELSERHGVGFTVVRSSNHFGTVGYYVRIATRRGMIALGATNSASVVAPTRARVKYLGTNPLAFGAPADGGPGVSLDMSTSAVAGGKLEVAMRERRPIPAGWGITADGEQTTDPSAVIPAGGALLPLGGTEEHGSYKGYGLALMVEALTSMLAGGAFARGVGPLTSGEPTKPADVSHFFCVIDPQRFQDREGGYAQRLGALCDELRALPAVDPDLPVLVPGDPEEEVLARRRAEGIPIPDPVEESLAGLAADVGVALP